MLLGTKNTLAISHMASHPADAMYPDTLAISYDEQNSRVSVVYNDHSFYTDIVTAVTSWEVSTAHKLRSVSSVIFLTGWISAFCQLSCLKFFNSGHANL